MGSGGGAAAPAAAGGAAAGGPAADAPAAEEKKEEGEITSSPYRLCTTDSRLQHRKRSRTRTWVSVCSIKLAAACRSAQLELDGKSNAALLITQNLIDQQIMIPTIVKLVYEHCDLLSTCAAPGYLGESSTPGTSQITIDIYSTALDPRLYIRNWTKMVMSSAMVPSRVSSVQQS